MLKKVLSDTKIAVRNHIKSGHSGREAAMQAIVISAERRGTKEIRRAAKKLLKEREGVTANPQDMNYQELAKYIQYIDYLKDIYEAAADI